MNTIDALMSEFSGDDVATAQMRATLVALAEAADATPVPAPSDAVLALISAGIHPRVLRRRAAVAAAAGALAFGGTSVAAAENALPAPVQRAVAGFANAHLPVTLPTPTDTPAKPVKPTNAPYDVPGHVRHKPKATKTPKPVKTTAPGQVQKLTKPDTALPGPAHPANPGSHGRAHHATKSGHKDSKPSHSHRAKADHHASGDKGDKPDKASKQK